MNEQLIVLIAEECSEYGYRGEIYNLYMNSDGATLVIEGGRDYHEHEEDFYKSYGSCAQALEELEGWIVLDECIITQIGVI